MKKRIFMALLAAVSAFAMVSCGDDKKAQRQHKATRTSNLILLIHFITYATENSTVIEEIERLKGANISMEINKGRKKIEKYF